MKTMDYKTETLVQTKAAASAVVAGTAVGYSWLQPAHDILEFGSLVIGILVGLASLTWYIRLHLDGPSGGKTKNEDSTGE